MDTPLVLRGVSASEIIPISLSCGTRRTRSLDAFLQHGDAGSPANQTDFRKCIGGDSPGKEKKFI